jgi:predicted DNA-binding antitoxin AbrB/MazE fold protein
MTRTTEAIFTNGVLKPVESLPLREQERVRITIESVPATNGAHDAAVRRLAAGFDKMRLRTGGTPPPREDLHERR